MKHNAILELYPNVKTVDESLDGVITAYDSNLNPVEIDMSAVETKASELQTAEDNKKTQKVNDQVSGNQKLLDLGLTQAEATALTGYTPPAAD